MLDEFALLHIWTNLVKEEDKMFIVLFDYVVDIDRIIIHICNIGIISKINLRRMMLYYA